MECLDSAACNEAVKLAKKRGFHTLKGFVNGVLRNIARNKENITYPEKEKEPVAYLSVIYSLPEWLVRQWKDEYGMERTEQMAAAFLKEQPTTVRIQYRTHHQKRTDGAAAKRGSRGIGVCADGGCLVPVRV